MRIAFVPVMIIPYWSIDLFFVASFFVCRTREELDVLSKRILFCIGIAGASFLLFPLRLAFPRPEVSGILGPLFDFLRGFDEPHNLFPSLHIAFWTLLAGLYAAVTQGPLRVAVHAWFALVGISTILTYQHQGSIGGTSLCLHRGH